MLTERLIEKGPWLLAALLAAAFGGWVATVEPRPGSAPAVLDPHGVPVRYESHVRPLFEQYCFGCHGERKRAGLDLRAYVDAASVLANRKTFEAVLQNLESNLMPPENKPQPAPAERAQLVAWLKRELFTVDCSKPDPGRVTLRRLNRTEYNNTIRDLVGVDFQPAADFPMDDVGYGFDNIGDVLSLPPVLLEKYLAAAQRILDQAIVTGPPPPPTRRFQGDQLQGGTPDDAGGRALFSQGEIRVEHDFPVTGEYALRLSVYGDQAGPEPVRIALRLGDQPLGVFDVTAPANAPQVIATNLHLAAGRQRLAVAFLNDYYRPDAPDPARRDRNFHLLGVEIAGPLSAHPPPLPESHRRIFFAAPAARTPEAERDCARELVGEFARRAYRRPVTPDEVARLLRLYETARADGGNFEAGVKLALTATLVSPHFLFRGELQPEPDNPRAVHPINEFALASRLSYFLWSTMPDEELFRLAGQGRLRKELKAQVRRMLRDPKARALVDNFVGQWLQFRNLDVAAPDPATYPGFNDELRAVMRREAELFAEHILREDRSVLEFLDADWTFVNEPLARHYGLAGVEGGAFRKVSLQGTRRGGVLTQGSFLTITSNPTRTSPVKRGKWVLENLLNAPPPPPPPDVPELPDNPEARLTGSLRQRFEQHRADPMCASCHALMDPIGFGFENFDGVGAWREQDEGFPIDPAGQLASGETFRGPDDLKRILLTARREEFLRCLASKMLTYALGRGLEYYDQCAVDSVVETLQRGQHRFSALVLGVVQSVPFQQRRGESGSPEVAARP
jgi:mono/diheme cytochrome c family protein